MIITSAWVSIVTPHERHQQCACLVRCGRSISFRERLRLSTISRMDTFEFFDESRWVGSLGFLWNAYKPTLWLHCHLQSTLRHCECDEGTAGRPDVATVRLRHSSTQVHCDYFRAMNIGSLGVLLAQKLFSGIDGQEGNWSKWLLQTGAKNAWFRSYSLSSRQSYSWLVVATNGPSLRYQSQMYHRLLCEWCPIDSIYGQ